MRGTIAGNAMIANTITATQIAADTITGNNIAGNTITSINIQTGTITANNIAGNTITGNKIAAGTITTNNFTANTITGNIISAGTITADQLAANAITANTVVSTGAVLGSDASLGFWLQGNTGNARFGNSLSVGNKLRVGDSAEIGGYLVVGQNAYISNNLNIGDNCGIGSSLSVGADATIASNLSVGSGANIGTNARIGANLIVGNNANIGGNLLVSGLISSGNLIANTVNTTTIVPNAVSGGINASTTSNQSFTNPATGVLLISNVVSTITTTQSNQPVYVWAQAYTSWGINASSANYSFQEVAYLQRVNSANVATNIFSQNFVVTNPSTQVGINFTPTWAGFIDIPPTPGTYTYRVAMTWNNAGSSPTSVFTVQSGTYGFRSVLTQTLKR